MSKYTCNVDNVKETLSLYGVAVIEGVLSKPKCTQLYEGMWDFLEHITQKWETPITRSCGWQGFSNLFPKHSMLIQQWGIGHAQAIWEVRQNGRVIEPFAKIWNCRSCDLLVSFDGASIHLPSEVTGKGWFRKAWYHTDQSYQRNSFECIQGWVTALPVEETDATLAFLESSHRLHGDFAEAHPKWKKSRDDWCKLEDSEVEWYKEQGCTEQRISCPAGSLVLWDSRTIHCGVEPIRKRPRGIQRCVAYVCYTPRRLITPALLRKKVKAFHELRTTNHWPHRPKLFPKIPRTYGAEVPEMVNVPVPKLNPLGEMLAGLKAPPPMPPSPPSIGGAAAAGGGGSG